jgi:hypothetical protein
MINLNEYSKKIHSQSGEDGIIEKAFQELGIERGWYCEFGAGDGYWISNTRNLRDKGWSGVLIEGDQESFDNLKNGFIDRTDVVPIQSYVSCEPGESLDDLLSQTEIPKDFDVLSIDVDGNDLWIWKSLKNYNPKFVIAEYNPHYSPEQSLTIAYDPNHRFNYDDYYGATAGAFNKLADEKGYILVANTGGLNLFYCRKDLADKFLPMDLKDVHHGEGWPKSGREMMEY